MGLLSEKELLSCGLGKEDVVLSAFSGGADSTALLLSLWELQEQGLLKKVCAAHFQHGIRGSEAEADLAFCKALAQKKNIPFYWERGDAPKFAKERGLTLETAARELRYAFLRRTAKLCAADAVALGHHREDQAETVLLHLLRGSGLHGLTGMAMRSGLLARPLLEVSKDDILRYLLELNQPYCLDSTNLLPDADRNRLRLGVMPKLKEINPGALEHIAQCAQKLLREDRFLEEAGAKALKEAKGSRKALSRLDPVLLDRALLQLLRERTKDYTEVDVERLRSLVKGPSGNKALLRGGITVLASGDALCFDPEVPAFFTGELPVNGFCETPWGSFTARSVQKASFPCGKEEAYINRDALSGPLSVRTPAAGDRFTPFGMTGSKLLSDYYTDRKTPLLQRREPVVYDLEGPVFLPGYTVDRRVRVTEDTTDILYIHYERREPFHG